MALEQVLALRVHLDESSDRNGPLRVLPGTHLMGVLTDDAIEQLASQIAALDCVVTAGGVVAMRPLIVHASSKIADRGAETRLAHRIRGTHGHGGLSRTREGLMIRNRGQFLPHLRICNTFDANVLANAILGTLASSAMLDKLKERGFELQFESHAASILERDFPVALTDIERTLLSFEVPIAEIIGSGGGETKGTQRLRKALADLGWPFKIYEIKKTINGVPRESISHEIDHVKAFKGEWEGTKDIALEIEWNNKDPFFDRDLENFKRLHVEGAISVGIVITRGTSLQKGMRDLVTRYAKEQGINSFDDLTRLGIGLTHPQRADLERRIKRTKDFGESWASVFVASKFGEATTHWRKLMDRVSRGVGSPCPLLLVGFPGEIVTFRATAETGEAEPVAIEEPTP